MPFDARAVAAESTSEHPPFTFTDMDGTEQTLPHPGMLSADEAARFENLENVEDGAALSALFEFLAELSPEASQAIRVMPMHVATKLLEAWQQEVDDLGKSDSQSSPPNRAARRSKRTSSSAASKPKGSGSTK